MIQKITIFLSLALLSMPLLASGDYFHCGFSNLDGSGQDYAKWGKGTDFKFNKTKDRWEWVSEYTYQYVYPDGRYEQIARVDYFDNQRGQCNEEMENTYKRKMGEIKEKYGK